MYSITSCRNVPFGHAGGGVQLSAIETVLTDNENTSGLLRQYLPKKTDFSLLTDEHLKAYVRQLNQRPRKCLDYRTPVEVFWERNVPLTM